MSDASPWRIPADAPDWECSWEGDDLFHLRYFRALSLPEKIRAVEQMEQIAAVLAGSRRRGRCREGQGNALFTLGDRQTARAGIKGADVAKGISTARGRRRP